MKTIIVEIKISVDGFNGRVNITEEIVHKLRSGAK